MTTFSSPPPPFFFRDFQIILHFDTNVISSTKILSHSYFTNLDRRVIYLRIKFWYWSIVFFFSSILLPPLCSLSLSLLYRLECKGVTGWNNPECSPIWTVTSARKGVLLRFCCLQIGRRVLSNGFCLTLTNYYTQVRGVSRESPVQAAKPVWTV
jgi:hypothetical protein